MKIIAYYSPTNEADNKEKDVFCNMQQSAIKDVPRY